MHRRTFVMSGLAALIIPGLAWAQGDNPLLGSWGSFMAPQFMHSLRPGWPKAEMNFIYHFSPDGSFFHLIQFKRTGFPTDGLITTEGRYRMESAGVSLSDCIETWKPDAYDAYGNVIPEDQAHYLNPPYRKSKPDDSGVYTYTIAGTELSMCPPNDDQHRDKPHNYWRQQSLDRPIR